MCKKFMMLCLLMMLTACGGGGGGGGGDDGSNPTPAPLSFSPSEITKTVDVGESVQFSVMATPNIEFTDTVYIYIVDDIGVIDPDVSIQFNPDETVTATMSTDASLAVGTHQGSLSIQVCHDNGCTDPYPGSPMALPYSIDVVDLINLNPLVPLVGAADWETFQGNAAHTGYVPVTLDPADFSQRYRWRAPQTDAEIQPLVSANGLAYIVSTGYNAASSVLYALDESDYSEAWSQDFGAVFTVNAPAVTAGNVYVATSGYDDTAMWSFAANTGNQRFSTPFRSQWEHYYAPTIDNGVVYTNGGYNGGLNTFATSDGSDVWFAGLNQYDEWTPAIDANYAYAYIGESCNGCNNAGLNIIDKTTGTIVNLILDADFNWNGWSIEGAPVISDSTTVIAVNQANRLYTNRLISFNISGLTINWSVPGSFPGNPAVAGEVVYVANNSPLQLEARDTSDGSLLWAWSPTGTGEDGFYGHVVATDNLIFVSTNQKVYAIDKTTHQSVWDYWHPGELSISRNGILYIATSDGSKSDGSVTAINLH